MNKPSNKQINDVIEAAIKGLALPVPLGWVFLYGALVFFIQPSFLFLALVVLYVGAILRYKIKGDQDEH